MKLATKLLISAALLGADGIFDALPSTMVANATEISSVWDDTTKKWVKPGEQSDPVPAKSNWRFYPKIDPITDQDTSAVMLSASSYSAAISDDPETLIVRCSKDAPGGYEIYITSKGYIGTHDRIAVEYRFDDNAPVSEYWGSSTDGTAAFLPSSYRDFRTQLQSADHLAFRWEDYQGTPSTAEFSDLEDRDGNLAYVMGGCEGEIE